MSAMTSHQRTYRLVLLAILTALVVVLQVVSSFVKFGPFAITLTLIPVVIGGILLGPKEGAALGGLFGLVVLIFCINGVDPGGNILFNANPFFTAVICLGKGAMAGFVPAVVYKALKKLNFVVAVILSAALAPVVNTGLFIVGALVFFNEILTSWAGGTAMLSYIIFGLCGLNFLVEFATNLIFSPALCTVIRAVTKKNITDR